MKVSSKLFARIINYDMFYIQFLFGQKSTMCIGTNYRVQAGFQPW